MSMSKRLMFDPEFASLRQVHAEAVIDAYQHRIPARRKNKLGAIPRWDPLWESAVHSAAEELGIHHVRINDGICFKGKEERDRVRARAEELWRAKREHHASL